MQVYSYRLAVLAALLTALACMVSSCGGGSRSPAPLANPEANPALPGSPAGTIELGALQTQLRDTAAPAGVDPEVFGQLTAELLRELSDTGQTRWASAPPAGELNAVSDLALVGSEALGYQLQWTYVNVGDYDQNGEVGVSDLTPIGLNFGAGEGDPYWEDARVADGDANGQINVSDITPVGQHFLNQMTGYEVFSSADIGDYPASPDDANGPGATLLGTVDLDTGSPDRQGRLRLSFDLSETGQSYWVRPVFGEQLGAASNRLDLIVELNPETVIIDEETGALLTDFTDNVLTFSASTAQLAGLAAGNVFVSGPLDAAPNGFMLKVTDVSGGGPVTVSGDPADLRDALASADFTAYIPLRVEDLKNPSSALLPEDWGPVKTTSGQVGVPLFLPIDTPVGSNAQLSGNVLLWPSLVLDFKLGPTIIDQLDFGASVELSGGLTLEGSVGGSWGNDNINLTTWDFTPIPFSLAGFPIVLNPSIDLVAGSSGNCTLEFTASAGIDAQLEGTIGYQGGSWGFHKSYSGQFSTPDPIINGEVHSDSFLGARLNLLIDGVAGGHGMLKAGYRVDADTAADPWWTTCAYVQGSVGVGLLGLNKDYDLFDECLVDRDAGGPFVAPPALSSWGYTLDHDVTADYDGFNAVLPQADGGVIAAGSSFLLPIVVKLDALGNVVWQRELDVPGEIQGLTQAADGGIIGVGRYISDGLLIKVDQTGALKWARSAGGPKSDVLYSVEPLTNGGYVAVGEYVTDAAYGECWVVRFDESGLVTGSTTYGTSNGDEFDAVTRNPDGSFYAAGSYSNERDAWLTKLDGAGTAVWHKRVSIFGKSPGTFDEWATGVAADGQGGCYLTGQTNRGTLTMWIIRYDPAGHGWVRQIDNEDFAITWDVSDIVGLRDGGMAICGQTGTAGPQGQRDGFVVCLSAGGGLNWSAAYGGSKDDGFFAIGEKQGGSGLIAAGSTQSFRTDNEQDAWCLLLRPGGTVSFTEGKGAGRSYLKGNLIDDEDLKVYYASIDATTTPLTLTEEDLSGTFGDYGSTPEKL